MSLHRQVETADLEKSARQEQKKQLWFPLPLILSHYSALSKKKRQINIVIHNSRLNSPCFYCFHVLLWAIQCAVTVTNASQSIVGEISELTSGMVGFFHTPFAFPSPLQNGQGVKQWSKTHKKTAVINKHNKNPDLETTFQGEGVLLCKCFCNLESVATNH